jgi:hypothetical protein
MSIFYVRKNGSGTHTTIQSAIYAAVNGDTIDVGEGTFYENVEMMGKNLTLQGAGKDKTIIQGKVANDTMVSSWFAGDSILTTSSTAAAIVGKTVSGSGVTTCRIAEVISGTQFRLDVATPTTGNYTKTVAAYQTIAFSVAPTSGTFKLRYNGVDTAAINWNDSAATIQARLRAVSGLSTVVVSGTIASKLLTIEFIGVTTPVLALSVSSSTLAPSVVITPTLIEALVQGSSTVFLPNATSVVIGHKVEGTGVDATITGWNATTRIMTLSSPITQTGSGIVLSFRLPRTNVTVTQTTNPSNSSGPASVMVTGSSNGLVIKNIWLKGFENSSTGQEAAALFFTAGTSPGHTNFLIDNCRITADGDCAVLCGSNPYLDGGVFQNCLIDGKTFTGSEPAEVPSFSSYSANAVVKSIGASSSVFTFSDMRGVIVGRGFTSPAFSGSATITAISGNDVTINKVSTSSVDSTVSCAFTLTAYQVPNVARNLFYIGQNTSPCNTKNITFKNNVVNGQTGAVISATGSKAMFNSAVTIESVGGLVENNIIDGNFGAGVNPLLSNFAIRCRQSGIVVQNNTNKTSGGRDNSGFLVQLGTSTNNITLSLLMVQNTQPVSGQTLSFQMDKEQVKTISKVASDAFYSDPSNWHMVSFVYKNGSNNKRLTPSFKSFEDTKVSKLRYGMMSGDVMQLHKIIISKSNRQHLVIKRSEIDGASAFDFTLANSSTAAAWSGNSGGSGSGGSGSGITAYKYFKFAAKSSWMGGGNSNVYYTNGGVVGLSDIAFKDANGNTISMLGASLDNILQSSNYGTANLINGSIESTNADDLRAYALPNNSSYHDLFTITMASAVSVSKLLVGPQGGVGSIYNMPREFKLLASNDNVNFTEVFVATPDAGSDTWGNYKGQYREFTIGAVAAPSYGYYRLVLNSSCKSIYDTATTTMYCVLSDVKFKVNGVSVSPTSAVNSGDYWAGASSNLIDGNLSTESYAGSLGNNARYVDFTMSSAVSASSILIAPRDSGDYVPKEFTVLGSNDGVNFTLIKSFTASNSAGDWNLMQYREFTL